MPKKTALTRKNEKYRRHYYKPIAESNSLPDRYSRQEEFYKNMSTYLNKTQDERCEDNKDRDLTQHVASRWYRAPEISLICPNYDKSSDIWSMGLCTSRADGGL